MRSRRPDHNIIGRWWASFVDSDRLLALTKQLQSQENMGTEAEISVRPPAELQSLSWPQRCKAYLDLGKPNLSGLVVITGITGFYVATPNIASALFFHFVSGLFLTAIGACSLNMVIERDIDKAMQRTRHRPIP